MIQQRQKGGEKIFQLFAASDIPKMLISWMNE